MWTVTVSVAPAHEFLPDPLQQLPAAEHLAGMADQQMQQLELLAGGVHHLAVPPHLARRGIDGRSAALQRRPGRAGAAQHRLHPGHHLAGGVRLDDVVVGALPQAVDPLHLAGAGREHDHRHIAVAANGAKHVEAVYPG